MIPKKTWWMKIRHALANDFYRVGDCFQCNRGDWWIVKSTNYGRIWDAEKWVYVDPVEEMFDQGEKLIKELSR